MGSHPHPLRVLPKIKDIIKLKLTSTYIKIKTEFNLQYEEIKIHKA